MCAQLTLVFILLASSSAPGLVSALQQHLQRQCIFFLFPDDRTKPEMRHGQFLTSAQKMFSESGLSTTTFYIKKWKQESQLCQQDKYICLVTSDDLYTTQFQQEDMFHSHWLLVTSNNSSSDVSFDADALEVGWGNIQSRESGVIDVIRRLQQYKFSCSQSYNKGPNRTWSINTGLLRTAAERWPYLMGYELTAASLNNSPYSNVVQRDGEIQVDGMFGIIWRMLEKTLKFTTKFIIPDDRTWGSPKANGQWGGMIGMLDEHQIDAAVAQYTMTSDRSVVIDFVPQLSNSRYCLFVRRPTTHHFNWSGLLEPFSTTLWIVAVLVVCFLSTVYGTIHHIQQLRGAEKPLQFSWLHMVGVVCQQSHVESPNSVTCRLIFSVMYIMCQVLLAAYSASLVSSLTIVNEEATINTFQDLIQDKSYMVGVTENSPEKSFFMDTSNHVMRSIYQVMLTSPDSFPDMTRDGLQRACELKFAFFAPEVHGMNLLNSVTCSLKLLPNTCIKSSLSIPLQKNSPYKTSITDKLLMMRQSGLLNRLEKNLFMTTKEEISTWTSVQLNHVLPIMTILISGTMLAVMMAALEKLVYFRKHKSDVTVSNSIHK